MSLHTRRDFLRTAGVAAASAALSADLPSFAANAQDSKPRSDDYQVGVYFFPQWHVDPANEKRFGKGWSEWETVKAAKPQFAGHRQPIVPLWGYEDEADPKVMEKQIQTAADHGVDFFIFDWYWWPKTGPFLQRCLEEGYLGAKNNRRVKFCCMWANHQQVDRKTFDAAVERVVEKYFLHPAYWKIDGRPYFSFNETKTLIDGLGGIGPAREALEHFRARAKRAGLPGVHLNAIAYMCNDDYVRQLGYDSVTTYSWIHHVALPQLQTPYRYFRDQYLKYWETADREYSVPYFPNVTMGWDTTPRMPKTNVAVGNTPEAFLEALNMVKQRMDRRGGRKILTIEAWNEWTEGSYLEPDTVHGMKYLEAVKNVFGHS